MANKVRFGLKSLYFAPRTVNGQGVATYATPIAIPGARNISLSPIGDSSEFYADNILYWKAANNQGYDGNFEVALIPDEFKLQILGMRQDDKGKIVESLNNVYTDFALLWEFDGDANATRYVLYNCSANRPELSGTTTEASKTPDTSTISFTARGDENEHIKAYAEPGDDEYATWFTTVAVPGTFTP